MTTAADVARFVALHAGTAYAVLLAATLGLTAVGWYTLERRMGVASREAPPRRAVVLGLCVAVVAASVFAAMTAVGPKVAVAAFDTTFADTLAAHPPSAAWSALMRFFATVTHLGDRATLIAVTIAVTCFLAVRRQPLLAAGWLTACIGNGLLNPTLKRWFERARPVHDAAYATVGEYSFPSGHTSGSVVVYGMLAYVGIRLAPPRWRPWFAFGIAATVVTVGCSRAFLRVHWASDVVAGFASGSAWLTVCIVVVETLRRRALDDRR